MQSRPHRPRRAAALLAATCALGCAEDPPRDNAPIVLSDAASTDATPADAGADDPAPLGPLEDRLWTPPPPFEGPCPDGALVTPGGCGDAWRCPDDWLRAPDGFSCRPPPLPECAADSVALPDGTCLDPWPCPADWQPDADGACLPSVADCPDDAPVPGGCLPTPDCARGAPPGARWGDPGAAPGGDGSAARPFVDLAAAFTAGADRLALAPGRYAWPAAPHPAGLTLWGACPAQVELVAVVATADLRVDGVHLVGDDDRAALTVEAGDCAVVASRASSPSVAAHVAGGRLLIEGSRVGPGGRGVYVESGEAVVQGALFEALTGNAIRVDAAGVARFDRIHARETVGLVAAGRLTGADGHLVQSDGQAVGVLPGGDVELDRVAATWPDGALGVGVVVSGELHARDLTVVGPRDAGVLVQDDGARAHLERAWIGRVTATDGVIARGVAANPGAQIELSAARIDRGGALGLVAFGEVIADGVRVTDPEPAEATTVAILAADGGVLSGRRVAWSAASGFGAWAGADGLLDVEGATGQMAGGLAAAGAQAGTLRLTDVALVGGGAAVIDVGGSAVNPGGGPTALVGRRLRLTATPPGHGVVACAAAVEVTDAVVDGGRDGLALGGSSTHLTRVALAGFTDRGVSSVADPAAVGCVPRGGEPPPDPGSTSLAFGAIDGGTFGLLATQGGVITSADVAIGATTPPASTGALARVDSRIDLSGARVRGPVGLAADGGRLDAARVHVIGPDAPPPTQSPGALAQGGGVLALERVRVVEATGVAVGVGGVGTRLSASDLRVEQTRALPGDSGGAGLSVAEGGEATLTRLHLIDNRAIGMSVYGATAAVTDGVVERTAPDGGDTPRRGVGVGLAGGASVTVRGLIVRENHTVGLAVADAQLDARRVWVEGTDPAYADGPADGITFDGSPAATLTDFVARDQPGAGVVASGASVELRDGRIEGNGVGLLTRNAASVTTRRVTYAGNGIDTLCESACIDAPAPDEDP